MKNIKFILCIGLILVMAACNDDFLETAPKNGIVSDASFFKTTIDFDTYLMGIYAEVLGGFERNGVTNWIMVTGFVSQDMTGPDQIPKPLDQFMNASEWRIGVFWSNFYNISAKANQVLAKLPEAEIPEEDKTRIEGEALFFRGFAYFYLAAAFGDVPLILEPYEVSQGYMSRTPEDEIWNQVISDLTEAAVKLPTKAEWELSNLGRATKGAAYAYLSNAYMYREDWSNAETVSKSLEGLSYDLMPTARSFFSLQNPNNVESIFETQSRDVPNGSVMWSPYEYGTALPEFTAARLIGIEWAPAAGWGEMSMNRKLADSFEPGDDRRRNLIVSPGEKYKGETMNDTCLVPFKPEYAAISWSTKYWLGPSVTVGADYIHQNNVPVFRYAEFILNYAEILFMNGKRSEAYYQLNRIRERALLPELPVSPDETIFMEALMRERRHELNFEPNLWFHYTRTGTAAEYLKNEHGVTWNQAWSKFPIPQSERDLNQNLGQNDGY